MFHSYSRARYRIDLISMGLSKLSVNPDQQYIPHLIPSQSALHTYHKGKGKTVDWMHSLASQSNLYPLPNLSTLTSL